MPTLDGIASDVRAWYGGYLDTFTGLAASERTDLVSMGTAYLVAKTDEGWRFTAIVFTTP